MSIQGKGEIYDILLVNMKMIEHREGETILSRTYLYGSWQEALGAYASLTSEQRQGMAEVYQEAFAGYPWFEAFRCLKCDEFAKTDAVCGHCGGTIFTEAYPIDRLVSDYFPHMMSQYTPGVLVTLEDNGRMIGFTTGGVMTLGQLIENKYKGNPQILASIVTNTGVSLGEKVFYENETCIPVARQQEGFGGKLNLARVRVAVEMDSPLICGRTINLPWLGLKKRQLAGYGYDFVSFVPDGDTYEVDGEPRKFFMAIRRGSE